MILLIDHQDSFTYNLAQALLVLGAEVRVQAALGLSLADIERLAPDRILLGPGPGPPERAHLALELARAARWPILGVCLGHQALALAYGGRVERAPRAVHGETSPIEHAGQGLFRGLPNSFRAARYHSLCLAPGTCPSELLITAWTFEPATGTGPTQEAGSAPQRGAPIAMGLRHRYLPLEGVQFHPESIASEQGARLLGNFLSQRFLEPPRAAAQEAPSAQPSG